MYGFVLVMCCSGVQIGHLIACINQLSSTFAAKYPAFKENEGVSLSFLTGMGIFGSLIGSLIAYKVQDYGRVKVLVGATVLSLLGTILSLITGMGSLYIGRFFYGIGCGILSVCAPLFMEETLPSYLLSQF